MALIEIREVRDEADAEEVRRLAHDFIGFLRNRYPEMQTEIDAYLTGQNFAADLAGLLTVFNPPDGECLLGQVDGAPAGILMCKRKDPATCEMNRMFVTDAARGHGLGRRLCERLIERARGLGYRTMWLSALYRHHEALALYRSLGFRDIEGGELAGREIVMELDLG